MTIFDYIKDITVTKKGDLPLDAYLPFLVTRWLSFIHPDLAYMLNTINKQDIMLDKKRHYQCLLSLVPKFKRAPFIKYVKKEKEDKQDKGTSEQKIALLAEKLEISQREAKQLLFVD